MLTTGHLTLLYRGPLAHCNFTCGYCPFGESTTPPPTDELKRDAAALSRFVGQVERRQAPTSVLFTPRGEALIHRHYREALVRLSRAPHLQRVAIQTNLSCGLGWLSEARPDRLGLWTTYHPGQANRERFVERCSPLLRAGISFSVGVVGLLEHLDPILALRRELPTRVYLWINAFKRDPNYYDDNTIVRLRAIDPLFGYNLRPQPSRGRPCEAGCSVVTVQATGEQLTLNRCLFTDEVLGDLERGFDLHPSPRPCPEDHCRCHIGYVHLPHLEMARHFGAGLLERAAIQAAFENRPGRTMMPDR